MQVLALLLSSEEERTEAQEDVKDIQKTVSTQTNNLNLSLTPSYSLLAQKQRAELVLQFDAVAEMLRKQSSKELTQFNAVTEILRKQSSKELAQLKAINAGSRVAKLIFRTFAVLALVGSYCTGKAS